MSSNEASSDLNLLSDLIGWAKEAGADSADAVKMESRSISLAQRLREPEKLERSESIDLGLRVFVGKRQAIVSTSDVKLSALRELADRAVTMARAVPEDIYCGIADADLIAESFPELDISDPEHPSDDVLIARARAAEEAALAVPGVTNSEGAEASWGESRVALVASNGFAGSYALSGQSIQVVVLAGEGTGMERDYDFSSAVYGSDLEDPEVLGRHAGEKAVKRLNPRKVSTGQVPVVYDPRVAGRLVGSLASAINGGAIARGTSFLKDKLGERVMSGGLNIVDDPHRARGLRSKPFDAEGIANRRRLLVEDGILKTWIMDLRSARQLGLETTGHASRGAGGPPSPSATNLYLEAGTVSPGDLIADIKQGLYVTDLMGFGVNGVTGDYSQGAGGFWIEDGQITYPVSELTVASNLKDMYQKLTPANDLAFKYGINAPTLRVEGMTMAGA